jgi:hypothetical protein
MRFVICAPNWPDRMRRTHATSCESNLPSCAGIVRVDSCPSWWQPTQSTLPIRWRHFSWVMPFGILLPPPKSLAGGIFIIVYQ